MSASLVDTHTQPAVCCCTLLVAVVGASVNALCSAGQTLKLDYSNPFMSCVGIGASAAGVIMKCTASVNNLPAFISYTDPRWQAPASPQLASDVDGPGLTFEFP